MENVNVCRKNKELDYFNIDELYGGNQEIFSDAWMRLGGCGAVTACDLCIYLDMYKGTKGLYPYDLKSLSKEAYESFAMKMKPYLRPRYSGIDRPEIYIEGFSSYLADCGCTDVELGSISGNDAYPKARSFVISQIDSGFPVPYLNLRHRDKTFSDFEWHWFLLTGYEVFDSAMMVKAVSYGEYVWLDFARLWNTGYTRKGAMIQVTMPEHQSPVDCEAAAQQNT